MRHQGAPNPVENPVRPGQNVDAQWYNPSSDRDRHYQ